jgi:hypothetical protein
MKESFYIFEKGRGKGAIKAIKEIIKKILLKKKKILIF